MSKPLYTFETFGADGAVDAENAVISGVSMITGGLTAKGHGLEVDGKTLKQIYLCAKKMGQVPVKTNHGSGVDAVNGFLTNFRIDGDKVRGDWHLLRTYATTEHLLEMAERMPNSVGLSVAFRGEPETADGETIFHDEKTKTDYTLAAGGRKVPLKAGTPKHARCTELVSTDLVASPAANPGGMFSAGVDSLEKGMAKTTESNPTPAAEPTLADVMNAINGINQRIEAIEAGGQNDDEPELSDEEVQELIDNGTLVEDGEGGLMLAEEAGEGEGEGEGEDEGEGEGEHEAAEAALSNNDPIRYFEARCNKLEAMLAGEKQAKKRQAEQTMFATIEAKQEALITRFEEVQAENVALRELVAEYQSGGAVKLSSSAESIMFDESGEVEAGSPFEKRVAAKFTELRKSQPTLSEFSAKAEAMKFAIATYPADYTAHQKNKGITTL